MPERRRLYAVSVSGAPSPSAAAPTSVSQPRVPGYLGEAGMQNVPVLSYCWVTVAVAVLLKVALHLGVQTKRKPQSLS